MRLKKIVSWVTTCAAVVLYVTHAAALELPPAFTEEPPTSFGGQFTQMLYGLAFCIGLFLITAQIIARIRGRSPFRSSTRALAVIERLPLSGKASLVLVNYRGKELLCALTADGVDLLDHTKPEPPYSSMVIPFERHLDPATQHFSVEEPCEEDTRRYSA